MKLSMKREMKKLLAACMIMFIALTTFGGGISEVNAAAKNKALQISFSFDGKNDVKASEEEKAWYNNYYEANVDVDDKVVKVYGSTMSGQIYIPKKVLAKKNSRVVVSTGMNLNTTKERHYGWMDARYNFEITNTGKKIKLSAWDKEKEKNAKVGSYATCKAGKKAYKSYYVITLKNVPMTNVVLPWNEAEERQEDPVKLKKSAEYICNPAYSVCGLNTKTSGKMYFDNLKVINGKKTYYNVTFTKKPEWYGGRNKDKEMKRTKVKIVNF